MSEDDVATFLTCQTMVDGIVLTTDTGYCHELQCKVISEAVEADCIVEHDICLFKTNPYLKQ